MIYDVNTADVNCACVTNSHCQSLSAIIDAMTFNPDYIVPGSITGCFVADSLMLSTLECFYSHSDCLPKVSKYIREIYYPSLNDPQWFNAQSLVYHPTSDRFTPNVTIGSIINEMLIEKMESIDFIHYELCAPSYCAYSNTVRAKTNIEIIVTVISMIGGLCASLNIITPYIIQAVQYLFISMREKTTTTTTTR